MQYVREVPQAASASCQSASLDIPHVFEKARRGDDAAFRQILEAYKRRVFAVAMKFLSDRSLAEEAAQETFIRLYRSFRHYDPSRNFFTYLYRIVANVSLDLAKREKRFRETHDYLDAEEHPAAAQQKLEDGELYAAVRKLLLKIGPQQRLAYVLRDLEGLEIGEIAQILHCRDSTVRSHLHHARQALGGMLMKEFPELL